MIIYTYFTLSFCLRSRHFSILVSIIGTCRFVTTETGRSVIRQINEEMYGYGIHKQN